MKIAFVTNLPAHYNIGTFELLAREYEMDFYFFSDGREWYWPSEHRLRTGKFNFENLDGFRIGQTRITPSLPYKLYQGNYDIFIKCINGRFALPATFWTSRLLRKPFILWTGVWSRIHTLAQKLFFPITRYIYRRSDAIVVYGDHVKRYLTGEGVLPDRIFVAPHAIDNASYSRDIPVEEIISLRSSLKIPVENKIVLYLGRLEGSKGVQYLVDAFNMLNLPDTTLVIAGDGSLRTGLEAAAKITHNSERFVFVGYVPIEQAALFYSMAWVYVLPSITVRAGKEPWGLVVNEAFNQGTPVIATDAVGAAAGGLVQDGVNGFVVPERNSVVLAQRLNRILTNSNLRQLFSENAKRIVAQWNYEANVSGYRAAIEYASKPRTS